MISCSFFGTTSSHKIEARLREARRIKTIFQLVAISSNTNNFGLNNFVFMARSGESWRGLKSSQYARQRVGDEFSFNHDRARGLGSMGFECPSQLPNAPVNVIAEIFGEQP